MNELQALQEQLGELTADVEFLSKRSLQAGSVSFFSTSLLRRDTGRSSNSIVAIAYGLTSLEKQIMPSDSSDMDSCEAMWEKMPEHRKRGDALLAMQKARESAYWGKKDKK